MKDTELSKIFTTMMDKSITNNLSNTQDEIDIILGDKKLTSMKKAELLDCNLAMNTFIQKFTNKNFAVLKTDEYIQEYSGIQNMLSRQSAGRKFFLVPWVHPILCTLRFSKWTPAKNVTKSDLDVLKRKSNEIAVDHIKPVIPMVNVPKSEGNLAVLSIENLESPNSRTVHEDTDSDFDEKLDVDYLRNLELSFSETSSSGCRIHSVSSSSGINDSGLGNSQTIKEEAEEGTSKLNQTAPTLMTASDKRKAFANRSGDAFEQTNHSLDARPTSTPRGRGRSQRGLRGRRGRRLTK